MDPGPSTSTGASTQSRLVRESPSLEGLGEIYDQSEFEDYIVDEIEDTIQTRDRIDKDKQLRDIAEEVK